VRLCFKNKNKKLGEKGWVHGSQVTEHEDLGSVLSATKIHTHNTYPCSMMDNG
jgi:hypothetical protein